MSSDIISRSHFRKLEKLSCSVYTTDALMKKKLLIIRTYRHHSTAVSNDLILLVRTHRSLALALIWKSIQSTLMTVDSFHVLLDFILKGTKSNVTFFFTILICLIFWYFNKSVQLCVFVCVFYWVSVFSADVHLRCSNLHYIHYSALQKTRTLFTSCVLFIICNVMVGSCFIITQWP